MAGKSLIPQYILDESGKKIFVVLPVEEYESLLEDLHDLAVISERRRIPTMSFEDLERQLRSEGITPCM